MRVVPVTERLSRAQLLNLEPLRAAVSRGVVAVLALELFEVITLRVLDAMQGIVRSPNLPDRILRLCSHQSVDSSEERELAELLRLWLPLILTQVGPGMRPQLVALFGHALQRNLDGLVLPAPLRELPGVQKAESELSRQLATGMVDSLLGLSKSAADQLGQKDQVLEDLGIQTLDRFLGGARSHARTRRGAGTEPGTFGGVSRRIQTHQHVPTAHPRWRRRTDYRARWA